MSAVLEISLKVLYVQGLAIEVDQSTIEQLRAASPELQITTIAGSAAALAELRRTPGWQALFASPSLPQNEVLALIASLRRDRIPIAIVPIIDDAHQDLFASAVASGADDVLVRRDGTLISVNESLTRIRQSPHLFPAEQRRRISVLYAGRNPLVWNLLDQVPFVKADRVATTIDGTCPVRRPGSGDDSLRADAVIIDETPGEAHPLQVLKSVKAQASDLPVIMLTSAGGADIATAALELGADDTVLKTGIFRRRLIATLRRVHQRIEIAAQQHETRAREERLRQIVEHVPTGIMVVAGDGRVLAMNAAALQLFGASKPRDIVGRDFRDMVGSDDQAAVTDLIRKVTKGEPASVSFAALAIGGARFAAHIDAVVLERDARGGRGLVASITRAGQRPGSADAEATDARTAELEALRDALQRLERHYGELEDARAGERAAWETERRRLELRVEEAERLTAERAAVEARLDEATAELARTSATFLAERTALEARLQELEAAVGAASAAGTIRSELEAAVSTLREELRQAVAAHALERSGWQEIRSELEARVGQLHAAHQAEQDTLVASLQQDVSRLEQTLAAERERWETTRQQLEVELRDAREALWAEHNDRDVARAAFEGELTALRASFDQERSAWHETRDALEHELALARDAAVSGRAELDRTRADLDQSLATLRATLDSERGLRESQQETFEETRRDLEARHDAERAAWDQRQRAFEDERRQLLEQSASGSDLAAERARIEAEVENARQQWSNLREVTERELAEAREQAERAEEAHRALADEYDATRTRLEEERDEARAAADRTSREQLSRFEALQVELAAARAAALDATRTLEDARRQWAAEQATAGERQDSERAEWQNRITALDGALQQANDERARLESEWALERRRLETATAEAVANGEQERGHLVSFHARELEEWRQAVNRARAERDAAHQRVDALAAELDQARAQLADATRLQGDLDTARGERDAAHQRVEALAADLDQARAQLADATRLQGDLDAARGERDAAHQRVEVLAGELNRARAQLADATRLQGDLDAVRGERDAAHQRVEAFAAELDQARAQLADVTRLQGDLDAARGERDAAHQRVEVLAAELDQARAQLADATRLQGDLDAARGERDAAHQRVEALAAELDQARAQLADATRLQGDIDAARGERDAAHQRVEVLAAELDQARAQLADATRLQGDLDAARGERDAAHQRVEALQRALEVARNERDQAWQQARTLESELSAAQRDRDDHQSVIDALEAARNEIRHTDAAHHDERRQWHRDRQDLEQRLHALETQRDEERTVWSHTRAQLEADAAEASRLLQEQQQLHDTITSLHREYDALLTAADAERSAQARHVSESESLRNALAGAEARLARMDAALDYTARSADDQLARQSASHDGRIRELEAEIQHLQSRLADASAVAASDRTGLQFEIRRASLNHTRLIESDLFGYALTTMDGELLKCNDAFARIFGYVSAPDALGRTSGRPFPGLAGRADIDARLRADGRVDRVSSCVERLDGSAVRIFESALILEPEAAEGRRTIEHILTPGPGGPTPEDVQGRRLQEVGALTTAMVPELESLASTIHTRSTELGEPTSGRTLSAANIESLRVISGQIAALVRQLAAFSRRQIRGPESLELRSVVAEAEPMLSRLAGQYIAFSTEFAPTTPISALREDLDQLLTSLVTLGRDLLPAGGAMVVGVRQDGPSAATERTDQHGPVLLVSASGYGVQFPGSATALELVAQRCGGVLRVTGEPGWIVRLEVIFPRCGPPTLPGWDWLTE